MLHLYYTIEFRYSQQQTFGFANRENISIKCERGFKPFSHYFFTESEVQ